VPDPTRERSAAPGKEASVEDALKVIDDVRVDAWLTIDHNLEVCYTIVRMDESTVTVPVQKASTMDGAKVIITGMLIEMGYQPAGDWTAHHDRPTGVGPVELSRGFRRD
jgi:hypothetical protein